MEIILCFCMSKPTDEIGKRFHSFLLLYFLGVIGHTKFGSKAKHFKRDPFN